MEESTEDQANRCDVDSEEIDEPVLKVNPADFDYDETSDTVKPKDTNAFDTLIEHHPTVHKLKRGDKRDKKVAGLKAKVLDTLKVAEKKKRHLSCDSVKSDCSGWGENDYKERNPSRGRVRQRSEESKDQESKKSKSLKKTVLLPPKIILSQN